jgi:hypothetical protein
MLIFIIKFHILDQAVVGHKAPERLFIDYSCSTLKIRTVFHDFYKLN